MRPTLTYALLALALLVGGCTHQNPEWAESVNPCCGQDELLEGHEPSEEDCADMVVSQEVAMRLAWLAASSSGATQWRVRLLPGGPACIYKKYPGLMKSDYLTVEKAGPDTVLGGIEPAPADTAGASRSAPTKE